MRYFLLNNQGLAGQNLIVRGQNQSIETQNLESLAK
jgi:hypothetical protein